MEQIDQITGIKNTMCIYEQVAELRAQEVRAQEQKKAVKAFLISTRFSPEKIASLVGVPISFVEKLKKNRRNH